MCGQEQYGYRSLTVSLSFNVDGTPKLLEWEGSCQRGVCYECSIAPIPTAPIAYCNDGRCCVDTKFGYAVVGIFSSSFLKYNQFTVGVWIGVGFVTVGILCLLLCLVVFVYYSRKQLKRMTELKAQSAALERAPSVSDAFGAEADGDRQPLLSVQ